MDQLTGVDQNTMKYIALGVSFLGVLKSNFISQTFFTAPSYSLADMALTAELINNLEMIRDGYHSFANTMTFATAATPDDYVTDVYYSVDVIFSLFAASVFLQFGILALISKYLAESWFLGALWGDIIDSALQYTLVGLLPDLLLNTAPLFLNWYRFAY